jgi:hypothetical protein
MGRSVFLIRTGLLLAGLSLTNVSMFAKPRHPSVASLDQNSRALFTISMRWGDESWDPQTRFLRAPEAYNVARPAEARAGNGHVPNHFLVRDSTWYAIGLLLRDKPGDRDRAAQILRAVMKQQYNEPGKVWDGTFRRSPEEPEPAQDAVMWRAYDPNWREFVGTAFAVILNEYPDRLPAGLAEELYVSINHAVEGEMKQGRLSPSYTNIALMYGYLWALAAEHSHRSDWAEQAAQWQENVYEIFKQHGAFTEYNSPTYAGVDFFGTALWRDYGLTPRTRSLGIEMEESLWRAIADFYNANLLNISGPYDRSYGMDMQSYVSVVGLCLGTVLPQKQWPLPNLDHPPVDHVADLFFTPALAVVDMSVPADAMKSFRALQAEHQVRRQITDERIATAWIGKDVIYGGEITGHTRGVDAQSQFHPATVQWQMPGGQTNGEKIGWIQLTRTPPIDASATKGQIAITASGDVSFVIYAPGISSSQLQQNLWTLPGLNVHVSADAKSFHAHAENGLGELTYTGMTKMTLNIGTGK